MKKLRAKALQILRPPLRHDLSIWLEAHVRLPEDVSAVPGPIRLYPFQRGIADAISDPLVSRVTVLKSVRIGYTTLVIGAVANYVANDPAPVLIVVPTEDDCRRLVVNDLEPIFEASPSLKAVLSGDQMENNRNTMLSRRFPGGSLKAVAAKAPRNLRAHNARVLIIDEADAMEMTREGSPIMLAERRTLSFPDRKIIIGSTPVFEETSHVSRAYRSSDQRIYEVPCPECGDFHEIKWKDIRWPEGEPRKAAWACPSCGSVIEERHKVAMVENGRWRATAPHVEGHAGFRLNALISSLANASWGVLAAEFLQAKESPEELQAFTNTVLGEAWTQSGDEIDDGDLYARSEVFSLDKIPDEVLCITAGVDVQRDRLEAALYGWDREGTAYALGHRVIWGQPSDLETWAELDELLRDRFAHPLGGKIGIEAACIDSGDGETMEAVYAFAFPRMRKKIMAIKGTTGTRPWIEKSRQKIRGGFLWIVGVDGLKAHIFSRLGNPGALRFSRELGQAWFEQLASERLVTRYSRGQPQRRFERIPGRRAEALDCTVYAFAAKQLCQVNWSRRAEELARPDLASAAPQRPKVIRSSWIDS